MTAYTGTVESLRRTFRSGKTQSLSYRKHCLQSLINLLNDNCDEICGAIYKDIRKCKTEAYCYENYFVLNEAKDAIRNLKEWAAPKHVSRNLLQALDSAYISKQPLGIVLIIGPWNYPIQLLLCPLVGAIAADSKAYLNHSAMCHYQPDKDFQLVNRLPKYKDDVVTVVNGGVEETTELVKERFDHIFFTGSTLVGKQIMQAATHPVIVDKESNIALTAKRIAWGKLIACGQTCLAPDYIYCHESIKNELIEELKKSIGKAYGSNPQSSSDYCRIVNERHFARLSKLISHSGRIVYGGHLDRSDLYISPTILDDVSTNDPAMREEIFGPVLPILSYVNVEEAIEYVNDNEKPLALYVFSTNGSFVKDVLSRTSSGGVSVNDVIMHLALETLPFGGVGHSGMGRYHGKYSFDCFTHERSVLYRPQCGEKVQVCQMRYPPYDSTKLVWAKRVLSRRQLIPLPLLYFVPLCIFGFFMAFLLKDQCDDCGILVS
uniref:Aldehyde dehydrogenase n=1 Tax=Romanomermis culicivorax TaxID=13658 RepID=A0A915JLJ7_ROMCU